MAVFLFSRLERDKGGLTKAELLRASMFAAGGWSTHLALTRDTPDLDELLADLRSAGRLHPDVVVHRFSAERKRLPRRFAARIHTGDRVEQIATWLDWMVSNTRAVVFADSPVAVPALARMRDPRTGRIYVVHVAHLAKRAYRGASPTEVARGPLTQRFRDHVDPHISSLDRIVTLTALQRDDLVRRYGPSLPVATVPHFAELPAHRADLGAGGVDPCLVVGLGRLTANKRFDHGLRVMARVMADVPDARMVVHGRGEELPRLKDLAATLRIADRVKFAGYTTDPQGAVAGAACMLATGRREAMPLSELECLAVGTPVVGYDVRYGPAEIVRDGIDGFIVADGDIDAAADAVVRLLRDPVLRARMSASAVEVTQRFSFLDYQQAWLDLARQVLAEKA